MATILSQKEESTMGNRCRLLYDGNEILLFSINENYTKSFSLTAAADADATTAPARPAIRQYGICTAYDRATMRDGKRIYFILSIV